MLLVKFITDDDGQKHPSSKWHYVQNWGDSKRSLCTGECFGYGESSATYQTKVALKGGITCPRCIEIIKEVKAIKL